MATDVLGSTVLHEVADGVSTITLNREAANAILPEQRDVIIGLLAAANPDPAIRAVAIRARGKHFCSGADVGSVRVGWPGRTLVGDGMRRIMQGAQRLVAAVLDCPKTVVAVVQGTAAGLGARLAYACDMVVAAEEAAFLEPFLLRGMVVDAGGAYLLPRLVGMQRAKELMFLAEKLSAADAHQLGLVNRVVPTAELDATSYHAAGPAGRHAHQRPGLHQAPGERLPRPRPRRVVPCRGHLPGAAGPRPRRQGRGRIVPRAPPPRSSGDTDDDGRRTEIRPPHHRAREPAVLGHGRGGRFLIQRCGSSGAAQHYPRPFCATCWSEDAGAGRRPAAGARSTRTPRCS